MPPPCVAFGCRSGYRDCSGFTPDGQKITFHSFPLNNSDLLHKWIRANPRVDFVPTKYSKICSRHFRDHDFVEMHQDSNESRRQLKQSSDGGRLKKRYLKPDAVPSIFENVPTYLTASETTPRQTSMALASTRREAAARLLENMEESFTADDTISSLSLPQIEHKLKNEPTLPNGFCLHFIFKFIFII
jgi:hypothetical protein